MCSKLGPGLPRQKFESVQVALRNIDSFEDSRNWSSKGQSAPASKTRSRYPTESPAMFPSAHTACSRTSSLGEDSSWTKIGTASLSITTRVWSEVPEATFVNAHAASNWSFGKSCRLRNWTNRGMTPCFITSSIGGFRSTKRAIYVLEKGRGCTDGKYLSEFLSRFELLLCVFRPASSNHRGQLIQLKRR